MASIVYRQGTVFGGIPQYIQANKQVLSAIIALV